MEADLARFYNRDYRDRWRIDERGRPRLTLRQLWVLVRHLPDDSAVRGIDHEGFVWRLEHFLLDDVRQVVQASIPTKKPQKIEPHPDRPKGRRKPPSPDQIRKRNAALARARRRKQQIASGEIK